MLTRSDFILALRTAGLKPGDTALVQSDLLRIGPVDASPNREEILRFYLNALLEALGSSGTLVVLTSYEDYARYGKPFNRQTSPSLSGALSEYVRSRPNAVRSLHPVLSLTALGPRAEEICSGNHFEGFGYDSPWGRLHRMDARLLTLGYSLTPDGMTFLHYVENLYGVPYQYTKLFDYPVFDGDHEIAGCFTMPVRYLDFDIEYDQRRFKQGLVDRGLATLAPLGRGQMLATTCGAVVAHAIDAFSSDRYVMLAQRPKFRRGEIPYDMTHPACAVDTLRRHGGDCLR